MQKLGISAHYNSQALALAAEHNLSIIPLGIDKKPRFSWKKYQNERATEQELVAWQKQYNPAAWAVVTGAISDLVILDFDGEAGRETLEQLGLKPHVRTGSGGYHVYFRHPGWHVPTLNSKSKIAMGERWAGMDIRADGGYAAFSGSNANGPYTWLRAFSRDALDVLPNNLRSFLGLLQAPTALPAHSAMLARPKITPIAEAALSAQWGLDRIGALGGRNNAAFALACQLRDNNLSRSEAESIMQDFANRAPASNAHGDYEPFSEREAMTALEQAMSRGARDPWQSGKSLGRNIDALLASIDTAALDERNEKTEQKLILFAPHDLERETILTCLESGEYGDAVLFAKLFCGLLVYDHAEKQWYTWHAHAWRRDPVERIRMLISGRLSAAYLHCKADFLPEKAELEAQIAALIAEKNGELDPAVDTLKEKFRALTAKLASIDKRIKLLRGANHCRQILFFLVAMLGVSSADDQTFRGWDQAPWLLATKDGVVDLRSGTLRPGRPRDYIRTLSPATWLGLDAKAPRWERFLREIFADRAEAERDELIGFLQRALGYGIAGDVLEHFFLLFYGEEGRNGKDTMMEAINSVLGAHVGAVSKDVLLDPGRRGSLGAATPHLVALQGKRLAWASEPSQGERFDVGQVKFLTGGGEIPARKNYGEFYTFKPTHLLLLLSNHKPHADARDQAFWSRMCPVVFNLRFVDKPASQLASNERSADSTLKAALAEEASGILAWLVRGCMDYQKNGMQIPQAIRDERAKYQREEDTLALFVEQCCIVGRGFSVPQKALLESYKTWSFEQNIKPLSGPRFSQTMQKDYEHKRIHGGYYAFFGLKLVDFGPDSGEGEEVVKQSKNYFTNPKPASQASLGHIGEPSGEVGEENPQKSPIENEQKLSNTTFLVKDFTHFTQKENKSCETAPHAGLDEVKQNSNNFTQKTAKEKPLMEFD